MPPSQQNRGLWLVVYVLLGAAAAITAISLIGPNIDLAITGVLFDPSTHRFPAESNHLIATLRDHGMVAVYTCIGSIVLAMARSLPWRLPSIPARSAIFLTVSLLLGPGLLINGILKPHWGRPRPSEVVQFGGTLPYVDWWNPAGACNSNCSFMSGEAATAAWMFGPAMLAPPPWRAVAMAAAAVFTIAISGSRLAVGGHFFTDLLFAVVTTMLILLMVYRLMGLPAATRSGQGTRSP